jgi:hypothetical protein
MAAIDKLKLLASRKEADRPSLRAEEIVGQRKGRCQRPSSAR